MQYSSLVCCSDPHELVPRGCRYFPVVTARSPARHRDAAAGIHFAEVPVLNEIGFLLRRISPHAIARSQIETAAYGLRMMNELVEQDGAVEGVVRDVEVLVDKHPVRGVIGSPHAAGPV